MQILKKLFLSMTSSRRHQYPYDTHHGVVINRTKFEDCIYSSFRGVETDTQTELRFIYWISSSLSAMPDPGLGGINVNVFPFSSIFDKMQQFFYIKLCICF